MKNKILALLATIGLASSVTAVEINENLSINGFIDGSWQDRNEDHEPGTNNDSQDLSLDEVEINFLINVGNVSGFIAVDTDGSSDVNSVGVVDPLSLGSSAGASTASTGNAGDELFNIEQAHLTYTLDNGLSVTFGRYGSKLGLEREDPAGLYTFSRAYGDSGAGGSSAATNYGDVDSVSFEGIAFGYALESLSFNLSIDQDVNDNLENPGEGFNYEVSASYTGFENLVLNAGWRAQDNGLVGTESADTDHVNVNASYSIGKGLIAAEWQEASNDRTTAGSKGDVEAFQILVDYDFTDKLGAALRYSNEDQDSDERSGLEISKFTIAPNYAITDSLGLIIEYTAADVDAALGASSDDYDFVAAELTYTF
jgi:hypothetical protein